VCIVAFLYGLHSIHQSRLCLLLCGQFEWALNPLIHFWSTGFFWSTVRGAILQ
jgi:hypothetical protein